MTRYTARQLRELDGLGEFESTREDALTVTCPDPPAGCGRPPGARCTQPDGRLTRAPAHPARIRKFEQHHTLGAQP